MIRVRVRRSWKPRWFLDFPINVGLTSEGGESLLDIAEGAARKPGNRDCHGHSRLQPVNIGSVDRCQSHWPEQISLVLARLFYL